MTRLLSRPVMAAPASAATSSNFVNQWCCFDYGSGVNSHTDTGNATMNAIEWGTACQVIIWDCNGQTNQQWTLRS